MMIDCSDYGLIMFEVCLLVHKNTFACFCHDFEQCIIRGLASSTVCIRCTDILFASSGALD